jgi:hypothetical protein
MMRRITTLFAAIAIVALGVVAAQGSEKTAQQPPIDHLTRQLDEFEARLMQQEHQIAACMAERGFDYVARLPADWILERAYQLDVVKGGTGEVAVDLPEDPNGTIVAGLARAEAAAYQVALLGDAPTPGCAEQAYAAVFGLSPRLDADRLTRAADAVDEAMAADPRVVEARGGYVSCMERNGYDVTAIDDVFNQIDQRWEAAEAEARAKGVGTDDTDAYVKVAEFRDTVLPVHDSCVAPYYESIADIHAAYVSEFINEP